MTTLEKFVRKYVINPSTDCYEWSGFRFPKGYGQFQYGKKHILAHRAAYELFIGAIPEGQCVLHRCDNPCCVNPKHLFLGSNFDNVQDMVRKGRHSIGSKNGQSKLTEMSVQIIREARSEGFRTKDLAQYFKITSNHVSDIIKFKRWST